MILESLSLVNYKNFESQQFDFDPRINCLTGPNGIGKTNVLDAIYHLSFGKSYFNPITRQNIRHGEDFFVVEGRYLDRGKEEKIVVSAQRSQKKIIKRNGKIYDRLSDHIGLIPLVIISPADRDLILEGSETRRKFMDGVISQGDPTYLQDLIGYNKTLGQRNALIKYFVSNHTHNQDSLDVYDHQLDQLGKRLHQKRREFLETFQPIFLERYGAISNGKENVSLVYESQLNDKPLLELLKTNIQKDKMLQYTSQGVHKDDLKFRIDGFPIKKFGSQGQQKSYLIALKLAQFDFLKRQHQKQPILLLDDVFDKLDEQRVGEIVRLVDQESFGQLFISDTHADRTENVVKEIHQSYRMFQL
jgi:DNA replication and repair protein RecF